MRAPLPKPRRECLSPSTNGVSRTAESFGHFSVQARRRLTTADFDLHAYNRPDFRNFSSDVQRLDTAGVMDCQRRAAVILDDHLIGVVARLMAMPNSPD